MKYSNDWKSREKSSFQNRDWDNLTAFHKWHKKILGVTLSDKMLNFYIIWFIIIIVLGYFLS